MKATKDFKASIDGREISCKAGDEVEADAKALAKLMAAGLVENDKGKPRKGGAK